MVLPFVVGVLARRKSSGVIVKLFRFLIFGVVEALFAPNWDHKRLKEKN
jgi:hypothetical protein